MIDIKRLFLSSLRDSRAEKAEGKHFCSRRACSAPQKCSSQRTGRCCGFHLEGLRPLQTTSGFSFLPVFNVAHSSMRTNIPVNKERILQISFCNIPFFSRNSQFRVNSISVVPSVRVRASPLTLKDSAVPSSSSLSPLIL